MTVCKYCSPLSDIVLASPHWMVSLARDQAYLGRCAISARRHVHDLSSLSAEEWADLLDVVRNIETSAKKGLGAAMVNWNCSLNDAYAEEHPSPHVHWHMRPRYEHDVMIGQEIFKDEEFGHRRDPAKRRVVDAQTRKEIIRKIQEFL